MPIVYGCTFGVTPARGDPDEAFLTAIRSWVGDRWPAPRVWFHAAAHAACRLPDGSILRWEPFQGVEGMLYEFIWRHPDGGRPGVEWATHAVLFQGNGAIGTATNTYGWAEGGTTRRDAPASTSTAGTTRLAGSSLATWGGTSTS